MFFKTLQIFQLKDAANIDFAVIEQALKDNPLRKIGSQDEFTFGSLPLVRNSECWAINSNECLLFRFGKEEKSLPSSVLREELEAKVAEIEVVEGRKVGRKEKADIKEGLVFDLRAKAFSNLSDVWLYIDKKAELLALNTTNLGMTEQSFKLLQTMLGSFPMVPLQAQVSPSMVMTDWLMKNEVPASLETGDACDLQDSSEDRSSIKFKKLEPLSEDVTRHLEQGMSVKNIGLRWTDKMSFVLCDDLTIKSIKWDDALKEQAFNDSQGGGLSDLDANFALMSLTIRDFFQNYLVHWFEISMEALEQVAEHTVIECEESYVDPLYKQAVSIVRESRKATVSHLQRQLKIGYNRAADLIEEMERQGLVGPIGHNAQREVLISKEQYAPTA